MPDDFFEGEGSGASLQVAEPENDFFEGQGVSDPAKDDFFEGQGEQPKENPIEGFLKAVNETAQKFLGVQEIQARAQEENLQAQARELQAQEDPANWPSKKLNKMLPEAKTFEEQGLRDAAIKAQKEREKAVADRVLEAQGLNPEIGDFDKALGGNDFASELQTIHKEDTARTLAEHPYTSKGGEELRAAPKEIPIPIILGTELKNLPASEVAEVISRFQAGALRGLTLNLTDYIPKNIFTRTPIPEKVLNDQPELRKYQRAMGVGELVGYAVPMFLTGAGLGAFGITAPAANAFATGSIMGTVQKNIELVGSGKAAEMSLNDIMYETGKAGLLTGGAYLGFEKGGEFGNKVLPSLLKETSTSVTRPLMKFEIGPENIQEIMAIGKVNKEAGQFFSQLDNKGELARNIMKSGKTYQLIVPEESLSIYQDKPWFASVKEALALEPFKPKITKIGGEPFAKELGAEARPEAPAKQELKVTPEEARQLEAPTKTETPSTPPADTAGLPTQEQAGTPQQVPAPAVEAGIVSKPVEVGGELYQPMTMKESINDVLDELHEATTPSRTMEIAPIDQTEQTYGSGVVRQVGGGPIWAENIPRPELLAIQKNIAKGKPLTERQQGFWDRVTDEATRRNRDFNNQLKELEAINNEYQSAEATARNLGADENVIKEVSGDFLQAGTENTPIENVPQGKKYGIKFQTIKAPLLSSLEREHEKGKLLDINTEEEYAQHLKGIEGKIKSGEIKFQKANELGFYSQVSKTLEEKMPNYASPEQVKGILSQGVKQDELDWLGLDDFLKDKKKVSKQEVLDFIQQNNVKIEEVQKGSKADKELLERNLELSGAKLRELINAEASPQEIERVRIGHENLQRELGIARRETKFQNYQLPGGENYREVLLTIPSTAKNPDVAYGYNDFKSSHWDEPNVLAHFRLNDRKTELGKTLFIEEIQSDWHQEGREKGYQGITPPRLTEAQVERMNELLYQNEQVRAITDAEQTELERLESMAGETTGGQYSRKPAEGVPNAPFKKTWHELSLKRILRMATEEGYDAIAWTTGSQQSERYDLSKQISKVTYDGDILNSYDKNGKAVIGEGNVPQNKVEKYIGKEASRKLFETKKNSDNQHVLEGEDLKIESEGMKGFYDQMIPSFLNKYTKKWGSRVQDVETKYSPSREDKVNAYHAGKEIPEKYNSFKVHALKITPDMKLSVMEGQPMFQRGEGQAFEGGMEQVKELLKIIPSNYKIHFTNIAKDNYTGFVNTTRKLMVLTGNLRQDTVPHEAFHTVFNEVLAPAERQALIQEVKSNYQKALNAKGGDPDEGAEDVLADLFAKEWTKREKQTLSDKIKQFIKDTIQLIRNFGKGGKTIKGIFAKILRQKGTGKTANIHVKAPPEGGKLTPGEYGQVKTHARLKRELSVSMIKPASSPQELAGRIDQLNKFGQSNAILRRSGKLKKYAGVYKHKKSVPKEGEVVIGEGTIANEKTYVETLAHELGHAIEWHTAGRMSDPRLKMFGENLTPEIKKTIHDELVAVTTELVGAGEVAKKPGYYLKGSELFARFVETIVAFPGNLEKLAPTAWDYFNQNRIKTPMIQEFMEAVQGEIDKGAPKVVLMRDLRETYQKYLGKRVGDIAFDSEMTYRAMKERGKKVLGDFIEGKFKGVKDSPETLFRSAESIKISRGGIPEFGTRDFVTAHSPEEEGLLRQTGYLKMPELVREDGIAYPQYAKQRYTPEQAKILFDSLSPEGKKLITDFTSERKEAKDYFNREVIKEVNKINGQIEGWVHHYFPEQKGGTMQGGMKFKQKVAGTRKHRTGTEGYVEDFKLAMHKALTDLEGEKVFNDFIGKQFARVTKPIAEGQEPDPNWVEVAGNVKKGVGTPQEKKMAIIDQATGKAIPIRQPRYQMPKPIYERYKMWKGLIEEASFAVRLISDINRYWRINILAHVGSASKNFLSGGLQYTTKILADFYGEVLTGDATLPKTRRNVSAMLKVLLPKGWMNAPDWVYGGDLSNYYGQFGQAKGLLGEKIDVYANTVLKLFGSVERYWKKVIMLTEGVQDLKKLNEMTPEGLKLPTEEEKDLIASINKVTDLYAYDYDNISDWLAHHQKSVLGQAIKPFAVWPYKYSKQVLKMVGEAFDQTIPANKRYNNILSLATLVSVYATIALNQKKKQKTPEVPEGSSVPARYQTRGRTFVGTDENGLELFTRTSAYPFLNLTDAGMNLAQGHLESAKDNLSDMLGSIGPVGQLGMLALNYKTKYNMYTPTPVIIGDTLATYVPLSRHLNDVSRMLDPFMRKEKTFAQAFTKLIPTTNEDLQMKLHGEIRTEKVPLEGEMADLYGSRQGSRTTIEQELPNVWQDIVLSALTGIYISRVDPKKVEAYLLREQENEEDRALKAEREAIRKENMGT